MHLCVFSEGGCEDRVLGGPASGGKGCKGGNLIDCIRGKGESGRRGNTSRPVLVNIEEQL